MEVHLTQGKKFFSVVSLVGLLFVSVISAQATTIFQDNFDTENGGVGVLNYNSFSKWSVFDGTVDLVGNGFYDFFPGNGLYVDLDGSTSNAGVLQSKYSFTAGTYELSFYLGGSTRGDTNVVTVTLGDWSQVFTVSTGDGLVLKNFTLTTSSSGALSFSNSGGDNLGAILDNVTVATSQNLVPEPGTMVLFGTGIIGLAAFGRRKAN